MISEATNEGSGNVWKIGCVVLSFCLVWGALLFFLCILFFGGEIGESPGVLFPRDRSTYEAIVEMARLGQLDHDSVCQAETSSMSAYAVPSKYATSIRTECIFVYRKPAFMVEIAPRNPRDTIVYTDSFEGLKQTATCGIDGYVLEKIDDYWYVCHEDWN